MRFGKVRRNRKKGTATLPVTLPLGGALTATGKGLEPFQIDVPQTGTVDLLVKPKGAKERALKSKGKARVKETLTFTASCGATGQSASKIKLRKQLP